MRADRIICALDTTSLNDAAQIVKHLSPTVTRYKVGHGLASLGWDRVAEKLKMSGANHLFLDLKFHDVPHVVDIAVLRAFEAGYWMTTLHMSGGDEMLRSAKEAVGDSMLLMGVVNLTSLDTPTHISVWENAAERQRVRLVNGLICPGPDITRVKPLVADGLLVTPGVGLTDHPLPGQKRTMAACEAVASGADYVVIGRALTQAPDLEIALTQLLG